MEEILVITLIFTFLASVNSLSCDCDYKNRDAYCGAIPTCPSKSTLVFDACGCCQICSKIHGEECGGPWQIYGKCAPGLKCQTSAAIIDQIGAGGIFANSHAPKGLCLTQGEVLHRTQPCFIALKNYEDAKHSGSHRGKRQVNLYTTFKSPSKKPWIWTDIPRATQTRSTVPNIKTTYSLPYATGKDLPSPTQQPRTTIIQLLSKAVSSVSQQTSPPQLYMKSTVTTTSQPNITTVHSTDNQTMTNVLKLSNESTTTESSSMDYTETSSMEFTTEDSSSFTTDDLTTNVESTSESETTTPMVSMEMTTTPTVTTTPCPIKPRCTPEGWFAPTQCDPCTGECWCVHINGHEISNTRKHGRVRC